MLLSKPIPANAGRTLILTIIFLLVLTWITIKVMPAAHAAPTLAVIPSPNPNFRPSGKRNIDTIVLHYSSAINVDRRRWDDPVLVQSIFKRLGVSAHYLINRTGAIYQLVKEQNVAWHAGGSIMPAPDNRRNVNGFSIGIEIIATDASGYTDAEYRSLAALITRIKSRYPIRHLVGHDQIAGSRAVQLGLRRDTKRDPGAHFDWGRLRELLAQR
ncbi:MAG: N-acetylmuramoyl-L-alanine amidase [Armatimonadota bacterium]